MLPGPVLPGPVLPGAVLAIALFGLVVVLASATTLSWTITTRFEPLEGARNYTPTPMSEPTGAELPPPEVTPLTWTGPLAGIVLAVLGAVLLALLLRRLWLLRPRRRVEVIVSAPPTPHGPVSAEAQAAALSRAAKTALELLEEIPDPQDAVVRSWLALEQAAATVGAGRRPADSPTEFARGVLAATGADRAAVTRLLALYHQARFSAHPVGLAEVRQARECVLGLSHSLAGYEKALRSSVASAPAPRAAR